MEQKKDISRMLDEVLSINDFKGRMTWTKHITPEGLSEEVVKFSQECIEGPPRAGIIYFERLSDGGYEIGYYQSYD